MADELFENKISKLGKKVGKERSSSHLKEWMDGWIFK